MTKAEIQQLRKFINDNKNEVDSELSQYFIDLLDRCISSIEQLQQENEQYKKALKDSHSVLSLLLWKHGGSLTFSTREMVQFEQNDYELIRTDEPLMDGVTYSIRKIDK